MAQQEAFDPASSEWRDVTIPHDWSIELPTVENAPSLGGGGFAQTGVGWYRRTLRRPADHTDGRRYRVEFGGVFERSEVYLDGVLIGRHRYGYTPFSLEVTDQLSDDREHRLVVRVDNSHQPNSRWYTGSGVYRPVWLHSHPAMHVADAWLETRELTENTAEVFVRATVANTTDARVAAEATVRLLDESGAQVAQQTADVVVDGQESSTFSVTLRVAKPRAWSTETPYLYRLVVDLRPTDKHDQLNKRRERIDRWESACGLRTIEVSPRKGLLVNGEPLKLFGGNVHHDHGPLGAAAYNEAEWRRVRLLKEAGFNAIRVAHNPSSRALLDACDTLGMWVMDEAFDNWRTPKVANDYGPSFDEHSRSDLVATITRDRGRPCVLMWSIGNEVEERGDPEGAAIARRLIATVREHDPSRPITAGVNKVFDGRDWDVVQPLIETLDIAGYNYETDRIEEDVRRFPDRVIVSSESYPADAFKSWRATHSDPRSVGDFVWSAIDYLGEAGIGRAFPPGEKPRGHWEGSHFPFRAAVCGDIDLIGHRRPVSHFRQIVWDRGAKLYAAVAEPHERGDWGLSQWATQPAAAHWTWDVPPGAPLRVLVASRWPLVSVSHNGREVQRLNVSRESEFRGECRVAYQPGELSVAGIDEQGTVRERMVLSTAGPAAAVALSMEPAAYPKDSSVQFIRVRLIDKRGRTQPSADRPITFSTTGGAELLAVGNGNPCYTDAYTNPRCPTYRGHALAVVRLPDSDRPCEVIAVAEGLEPTRLRVDASTPRVASDPGG